MVSGFSDTFPVAIAAYQQFSQRRHEKLSILGITALEEMLWYGDRLTLLHHFFGRHPLVLSPKLAPDLDVVVEYYWIISVAVVVILASSSEGCSDNWTTWTLALPKEIEVSIIGTCNAFTGRAKTIEMRLGWQQVSRQIWLPTRLLMLTQDPPHFWIVFQHVSISFGTPK